MKKCKRRIGLSKDIVHVNDDFHEPLQNVEEKRMESLKKASLKVRKESMRINKEFSKIEYDPIK